MATRKKSGKKSATKKTAKRAASTTATGLLKPPKDAVIVRMYRIGHGDCFLLAFPGDTVDKPVYVLIDCGYKPGSPAKLKKPTGNREIADSIRAATGGHIHVAVITHEHQDHVNAITQKNFKDFKIDETWLAWTEDPKDDLANQLRKTWKDKLLGLLAARNRLAAVKDEPRLRYLDRFLGFELGGDDDKPFDPEAARTLLAAAKKKKDPLDSLNKKSMKIWKDLAARGPRFFRPHEDIVPLPGAANVRVYCMGPPRNEDQIADLNPSEDEEFHGLALSARSAGGYLAAAALAADEKREIPKPFDEAFSVPWNDALKYADYARYSSDPAPLKDGDDYDTPTSAEWRRIDNDWLYSSERLALDLVDQTNNSSLVLAFELGKGGKVLLFAADAQRGNWRSWSNATWKDGNQTVKAKDLLSRTVLYKVGHHGSHNATLNGTANDPHPNLSWMAQGSHGREFCAMITAVRKWAETQDGWDHPQKAIKDALLKKASGRVFQTDTDFDDMKKSDDGVQVDWDSFKSRTTGDRLYFDYTVKI